MQKIAGFIALVALIACGKENQNYKSRLTLVNAVPNSTGFLVEAGGKSISTNLQYGTPEFETEIPAITGQFHWKDNGGSVDSSFITDIPNGSSFLLVFYDSLAKHKTYIDTDSWKQKASDSKAYIRLVPLVINGEKLKLANDTNRVLTSEASFGSLSSMLFNTVDTTISTLKMFNGTAALDSITGVKLLVGRSYSVFAVGVLGASGDKKPKLILHLHPEQ